MNDIQAEAVSLALSEGHRTEILFAFLHIIFPEDTHRYFQTLPLLHLHVVNVVMCNAAYTLINTFTFSAGAPKSACLLWTELHSF